MRLIYVEVFFLILGYKTTSKWATFKFQYFYNYLLYNNNILNIDTGRPHHFFFLFPSITLKNNDKIYCYVVWFQNQYFVGHFVCPCLSFFHEKRTWGGCSKSRIIHSGKAKTCKAV